MCIQQTAVTFDKQNNVQGYALVMPSAEAAAKVQRLVKEGKAPTVAQVDAYLREHNDNDATNIMGVQS
jgi:hypothetical protein